MPSRTSPRVPPCKPGAERPQYARVRTVVRTVPTLGQPPRMARRNWLTLTARVVRLLATPASRTDKLVACSYDRVAAGYDEAWTTHMRGHARALLDRLEPDPGARSIDLTCGTGFFTGALAARTGGPTVGVDASAGMLRVARVAHPECTFVQADAAAYLRSCRSRSVDCVSCAWGLGYTSPMAVVREAARVLRPGGRLGIVDNSLFSLAGVLWTSMCAFAERPGALQHVMRVRFLPGPGTLAVLMRWNGLAVRAAWRGAHTYHVADGRAAIARLTATGAAAGFEFAAAEEERETVFARFAELLEQRRRGPEGIAITHRFLGAVGVKR